MDSISQDKFDLHLQNKLPAESWSHVISYLPRISRQNLAELEGFREIVERE
jgi:hypothetical protein